jgi:hypothetical protein
MDPKDSALIKSIRVMKNTRNLSGFPYGPGLNQEKRNEIMNLMKDICEKEMDELGCKFYQLEGMSKDNKEKLKNVLFEADNKNPFKELCGLNSDWPQGRAVITNED